jgi:hypothetical protein
MSSSGVSVTGNGPFEFTDPNGKQISIPLAALTLAGNKLTSSDSVWNTYLGSPAASGLAQYMLAKGLLASAPSPTPFPAMVIRAANVGSAGNAIRVTVTQPPPPPASPPIVDPTELPFTIQVVETNTYINQTTATIASTLKTANALVQVIGAAPMPGEPSGFHESFTGSSPEQIAVESGSPGTALFTLGPRTPGPNPADISVTITPDSGSPPAASTGSFSLTATWTSPTVTTTVDELVTTLATVLSQLGSQITISKPGSGAFSLPQAASTTLSGGTPTSAASAILYTSLP